MINYEIPDDVREYVLLFQAKAKAKKKNQKYSQQQAISQIIREYKEIKEKK